jgi:N6-L-threonylcarbamoyladenine synthase
LEEPIYILAIESSCDDTGVAILEHNRVLANEVYGQSVHAQFGGVIPEEASRQHMVNLMPVVQAALTKANIELKQLNAIAFTQSPGLMGSLLVGACFAKSMAHALNIPLIAVHHMEAHVASNLIDEPKPNFPFLCLTVSGGHTQIVLCENALKQTVLGKTIDDAAGEAFDKAAKMLGLPYPGGPLIDKYAQLGDPTKFEFAKPNMPELNFSFSGLKTSILYFLQKQVALNENFIVENLNDLCASIQSTIIAVLMKKLVKASKETGIKQVAIAGGVSANSGLRQAMQAHATRYNWQVFIPKFEYCTDNAAMIGITAYYKYLAQDFVGLDAEVKAR